MGSTPLTASQAMCLATSPLPCHRLCSQVDMVPCCCAADRAAGGVPCAPIPHTLVPRSHPVNRHVPGRVHIRSDAQLPCMQLSSWQSMANSQVIVGPRCCAADRAAGRVACTGKAEGVGGQVGRCHSALRGRLEVCADAAPLRAQAAAPQPLPHPRQPVQAARWDQHESCV